MAVLSHEPAYLLVPYPSTALWMPNSSGGTYQAGGCHTSQRASPLQHRHRHQRTQESQTPATSHKHTQLQWARARVGPTAGPPTAQVRSRSCCRALQQVPAAEEYQVPATVEYQGAHAHAKQLPAPLAAQRPAWFAPGPRANQHKRQASPHGTQTPVVAPQRRALRRC